MDTIIKNLSEIEARSAEVLQQANEQKKRIDAEMRERTEAFDRALEAETEQKLADVRRELGEKAEADLKAHRAQADALMQEIAANYEKNHEALAKALFEQMTKG